MKDCRTDYFQAERRRGPSSRGECGVKGCTEPTTENKPYCIEHIGRSPHASQIAVYLASRAEEEGRALRRSGWKNIDTKGSRAREIVDYLTIHGAQSPKRLALNLEISSELLDAYIMAMEKAGLVRLLTLGSRRGTPRKVIALWDKAA